MNSDSKDRVCIDLGEGSELLYLPRLFPAAQCLEWMEYLDQQIPWTRPSLTIYGRTCPQPRETCYVASKGVPHYKYSGYQPPVHSWDDHPPLKEILKAVHQALPGCTFNSLLLNRYKDGADYVAWHSDNESLYGPTPTIASVTFGAEREFLIRKKKTGKTWKGEGSKSLRTAEDTKGTKRGRDGESEHVKTRGMALTHTVESVNSPTITRTCVSDSSGSVDIYHKLKTKREDEKSKLCKDKYSFMLKHGSLLVMKGYTQRDWEHSLPKRMKVPGLRINLTFRYVLEC